MANATDLSFSILVDNESAEGYQHEHGFAIWISAFGKKLLFDTGQGFSLVQNAGTSGIDLSSSDALILSHGHYDHTGGILNFLSINQNAEIFFHPDALKQRYSLKDVNNPKDISMPSEVRNALQLVSSKRKHFITKPTEIYPNIWLTGSIPRRFSLEDTGGAFFTDSDGNQPDAIDDDIALWIETEKGIIIVCGCCHSGLMNTIEYINTMTEHKDIIAIIGGFHLLNATQERLEATVQTLRTLKLSLLVPCHCTGEKAVELFKASFPNIVRKGYAGLKLKYSFV